MPDDIPSLTQLLLQNNPSQVPALLAMLERTQAAPPEQLRAQQLAQAGGVLALAQHTPGQAQRLAGFAPLESWDDFQRLPVLTRAELQQLGRSAELPRQPPAYHPGSETSTSGSTGTPLATRSTAAMSLLVRALQLRFQRWHAFDFSARVAFITAPQTHAHHGKKQFWAQPLGTGEGLAFDLLASAREQLEFLGRYSPRYLATYPSNLDSLLTTSEESGLVPHGLDAIILSSEPIGEELMARATRLWGTRVLPTYSSNEIGAMALAAPDDSGYAVMAENVILEVLDDDNRPCAPGQIGRVVVTTLQDLLRPLLRYDTGDYAELGHVPPGSPIQLPRLTRILGRERTMIRLPDGKRVWPYFELGPLLARPELERWQIVQRKDSTLLVRVVLRGELQPETHAALSHVVGEALPGLAITIEPVAAIERTARGKYLEVVSEL